MKRRPPSTGTTPGLRLLGPVVLCLDGRPIAEVGYAKVRALLSYLAMAEGKSQRRELLADLLWPGKASKRARHNLRQALLSLRSILGNAGHLLHTSEERVALDVGAMALDVAEFTRDHDYSDLFFMERLAVLYRGEFLADLSLPDCPEFDEWVEIQRESLHRRALLLLDHLARAHEEAGNHDRALPFAERFAQMEPWNEEGQRRAMRLYALTGRVSAALAQYATCCELLKRELRLLPAEETHRLAERIRRGELSPPALPTGTPSFPWRPTTERRQVTVLYCELNVALDDDPDEAIAQLRIPQANCAGIIELFGGHIVQAHGGALLAYFGYPRAREEAARDAVAAALSVCRETQEDVEVRAGVHTGLILVGGDGPVPDAVGRTSRLAMRLRYGVEQHKVVMSSETHAIVRGYFECVPLGEHAIPGFSQPVARFDVVRKSGARTRLEAAQQLSPLVGRGPELAALEAAWHEACEGRRRVLLIEGEAGIGKSRLLLSLLEALSDTPCLLRELRCFPEHSQSPFHPVIAEMEKVLDFTATDSDPEKFEKLVRHLESRFPSIAAEAIPLFAELLSLPLRAPFRRAELTPQRLKERTGELLQQVIAMNAAQQPMLLVLEDIHWIDPSTLELLNRFVSRADPRGALLVLLTTRPGFVAPWDPARVTTLTLGPLDPASVAAMVRSMRADLSGEQVGRIAERADGVPLFVEEMIRFGSWDAPNAVPATLHDLLAARMDMLGEARHVAQVAATLGREFDCAWLQALCPGAAVQRDLETLRAAGVVIPIGPRVYQFKHALIQEAAYHSQSRPDRQAAHLRVARLLQESHPEIVAHQPELVAQHLGAGGEPILAAEYWIRAGGRAALQSANEEAVSHFHNGLQQLTAVNPSEASKRLEAGLWLNLGMALIVSRGYGSLDARHAFSRAQALSEQVCDSGGVFTSLWGRWVGASSCEDYAHSVELAGQLMDLAQASGEPIALQQACLAVGSANLWRGRLEEARRHFERGLAFYEPAHHEPMIKRIGENVRISIGSQLLWVLWLLGLPREAAQVGADALTLAQEVNHPYSIGYIRAHLMILARWNGDTDTMHRLAEETIELAQQHGFHIWLVSGIAFQGLASAYRGERRGLDQLRQGVATVHAVMSGVEAFFMAALGEGLALLGETGEALTVFDEALAAVTAKDTRFWESEIHRQKGECLLALSNSNAAQAEACFERALAVSRAQGARPLEQRAAASLARLRQMQGMG